MSRYLKLIEMGDSRAAEAARDPEPAKSVSASSIIEAAFKPTVELVSPEPRVKVTPMRPEFPSCPDCRIARYWISPNGKVVCGKCGEVRFVLAALEYHPIQ